MPKIRQYNASDIDVALQEIKNGASIHFTARKFSIPRSTLQNRIHFRAKKSSFGPSPVLTSAEEQKIVDWLLANHSKGFPRRKQDVQNVVKEFLDAAPRENPFKNNIPGDKWYDSFLKRHPNIAIRTPEPITDASSKVAESNIRGWFTQIKSYIIEKNYETILEDPSRIFNGDETNFLMCPKSGKVIAPKGTKNVYETDRGQAKENLTVMFSFSASGFIVPPLIIYPYKRVPAEVINSIPDGLKWLKSDSGWMTTEVFYTYIKNIFYPSVVEQSITFPIILYVDGHRTHLTFELSKLCEELQIILICLYPNATRILQPADVSIFKPLKTGWKKAVLNWRKNNIDRKLTKSNFAPILKEVVDKYINVNSIVNGFRTCGLHPFNPDAIDYTKCLGKNSTSNELSDHPVDRIDDNRMLDFSKFKDLVGAEKLVQLMNPTEESHHEDFVILHKIYQSFIPSTDNNQDQTIIFQHDEGFENENDVWRPEVLNDINLGYFVEPSKPSNDLVSVEFQSIEFIDEFQGQDATASELHIIQLDDPNLNIGSFLTIPQTPVRMGIKNSDHRSFIISSTPFQRTEEEKINKKKMAQIEKEERAKEKLLKKEKKDEEALLKQQHKINKRLKQPTKQKAIKKRLANPSLKNLRRNNRQKKNATVTAVNVVPIELPQDQQNNESHVRQLFSNSEDDTPAEISNITRGICFKCAGHITINKVGITCNSCKTRIFHVDCAKSVSKDDKFDCKSCLAG